MLLNAAGFLSIYFVSALAVFATGYFLLFIFKNSLSVKGAFTKVFAAFFLGFISLVFVYSLSRSGVGTINLAIPLLLFLAFYKNRVEIGAIEIKPPEIKMVLFALPIALLPFLYFAGVLYKSGDFFYAAVDYDNVTYSSLSEQLRITGIESRWLNLYGDADKFSKAEPYHYFDLWFNALVSAIFSVKSLPALYLVTYPLLVLLSLSGILAIIEHYRPVSVLLMCLAILLLFTGPVYFIKNFNYHFNTTACEIPLQHYGEKYAVYYPFILFSLLLLLNNRIYESVLFIAGLCIVSFTVFPAVFVFVFFFLFLVRKHNGLDVKKASGRLLFFFGSLLLFYYLKGSLATGNSFQNTLEPEPVLNIKGRIADLFIGFFISSKYFVANYCYAFPLAAIFFMKVRFQNYRSLLLFLWLPVSGLAISVLFYRMQDNYQLFTNTLPFFHCLLICFFIILIARENKLSSFYLAVVFLALNAAYTTYSSYKEYRGMQAKAGVSDQYMRRLQAISQGVPYTSKIGFIYTSKDLEWLFKNPGSNYLYHLAYTNFNPVPVKLSCVEVSGLPEGLPYRNSFEKMNKQEQFYHYFTEQISRPGQSPGAIKLSFMRLQGINHVLLSPSAVLPSFLEKRVAEVVTDGQSGIKLLVLK